MYGIYLDDEHWIDDIPERLQNIEILKFEKNVENDEE